MHVSATILPRNACALGVDAGMRCSGTDAKVLYRVSRGNAAAELASAARDKVQPVAHVKQSRAGDVLTIEF